MKIKMPIVLLVAILLAYFLGPILPINILQIFYSISLFIKEILIFTLPFIIFSLLSSAMIRLQKGAIGLALMVLPVICISNFITTWIGYISGRQLLTKSTKIFTSLVATDSFHSVWHISLPKIIDNKYAMLLGLIIGIIFPRLNNIKANKFADIVSKYTIIFLEKIFIPVIPLFIVGFIFKLQQDGVLDFIFKNYLFVFGVIFITQISYILFLYGLGNKFKLYDWYLSVKRMLPAGITGFTTMSSAAAMPITLKAAEKNLNNKNLTRFVIPITVNFHLIGDCIAIPIMAIAILNSFGFAEPTTMEYLIFSSWFVFYKFAVAAVPGGGILVMVPILESYLGFKPEMLSLIIAIYILFDSVITSMNVMGNGAFIILFNKIRNFILGNKS